MSTGNNFGFTDSETTSEPSREMTATPTCC